MSRDYAKKPSKNGPAKNGRTRNRAPASSPRLRWLLSGFLLGVLFMGLIQLWKAPKEDITKVINEVTGSTPAKDIKPHFDFYTQLRDAEIIVPDGPSDDRVVQAKDPDEIYILQAGSFRQSQDADSLRAQLLLMNFATQIEKTRSSSGETWHRVLVGPFQSPSKLASARATLLQNGIDNLVLKRTKN